nr:phosphatase PAP2 family protein [Bifidobacterium samirii]
MMMKRGRALALALAVLLCVMVPVEGFWLRGSAAMTARETAVLETLGTLPGPVHAYAVACAALFSFGGCVAIVALLAVVEYVRTRSWRRLLVELVAAAGPILYVTGVKWLVVRPRPATSVGSAYLPSDPSFPSGHTAAAVIVAVMLVLMTRGTRWRLVAVVAGVALVLAVAFSRLVLGVHFPTDVTTSMIVCPVLSYALWQLLPSVDD